MRIAVAGNLIVDIIKRIERYPEKNMLTTVSEIRRGIGGCVPNVAIDLKKLRPDWSVEAYGRVGDDGEGRFLVEELGRYGVGTEHIAVDPVRSTSFCDVMMEKSGARTFFHHRGANAAFSEEDVGALQADLLHVGYAMLLDALDEADGEYGTRMARLLAHAQQRGILTSLDVVSETSGKFEAVVVPSVKYCDYVILNEAEAGLVAGIEPRRADGSIDMERLEAILKKFISFGVGRKVVVHCPELGASMRKSGEMAVVPSLRLPKGFIKGTVGAGDAFCAGMLYAELCGMGDEEGLLFAACSAAANLSAEDAVSGARSAEETYLFKEKFGGKL